MFLTPSKLPARTLGLIALASLASVAFALIAQHAFNVKPCPWCVMQRGIFLLLAACAGLGWLGKRQPALRKASLLACAVLALAGLTAAVYQHEVVAKLASCDMTLADRILTALDLETLLPSVFMVTASCSEASAYTVLGAPYEVWAGLLFACTGIAALLALRKS
jgi:disulfide bond formation protein DsbB